MYEELTQLIEQNKLTIANYIAEEAYLRKMASYIDKSKDLIAQLVLPTVEMIARYIRSSDPTEYRTYIHNLTLIRLEQGYGLDEFYTMGEILTIAIVRILDARLVGKEQARQKERFIRRLQGIQTLAQSTTIAAQFDFNKQKVNKPSVK